MISDRYGSILGIGIAGPSNYHNVGVSTATREIRTAFEAALSQSHVRKTREGQTRANEDDPVTTRGYSSRDFETCFGLAGLDSPADVKVMKRAIAALHFAPNAMVVNDWRTALAAAFVEGPGVILIAGTGCVAAGQDGAGGLVRVGGWGNVVDDRGSAYDIGKEALYAAMRAHDARGPPTMLLERLMERLRVDEPHGILERVYVEKMGVTQIASLCTVVARAAADGDQVALRILQEKGRALGELVVTAASRLNLVKEAFRVALNGGVLNAGRLIRAPLVKTIRAYAPSARLFKPTLMPPHGAVILLLLRAGLSVDGAVLSRMRRTSASIPDYKQLHSGGIYSILLHP